MTLKTVSVILTNSDGEVLLQLRDDRADLLWAGYWTLPGGQVEQGESPDVAIARELKEEMELEIAVELWKSFEGVRGHRNEINALEHIYVGKIDAPAESIPLHEGQRIAFFSRDEIGEMALAFGYNPLIEAYFDQYPE